MRKGCTSSQIFCREAWYADNDKMSFLSILLYLTITWMAFSSLPLELLQGNHLQLQSHRVKTVTPCTLSYLSAGHTENTQRNRAGLLHLSRQESYPKAKQTLSSNSPPHQDQTCTLIECSYVSIAFGTAKNFAYIQINATCESVIPLKKASCVTFCFSLLHWL